MIGDGVLRGWKEGGAGGVVSWGRGGENWWPGWAIAPPAISGAWAEGKNIKSPRKNISCLEARLAGPEAAVPLGPGHVRVAAGARVRGRADILQETPHLGQRGDNIISIIFYLFVSDNIIIHYCTLARFSRVFSAVAWPVQLPRVLPRVSVSTAAGPRAQRHVCSYSRTVSREC